MEVTFPGIVIEDRLLQPANMHVVIAVRLLERVTDFRLLQ